MTRCWIPQTSQDPEKYAPLKKLCSSFSNVLVFLTGLFFLVDEDFNLLDALPGESQGHHFFKYDERFI